MPASCTWHMRRRKPRGRSTTPTRRFSSVKHADVGLTKMSSRQKTAAWKTSLVVKSAQQTRAQSVASAAAGATAAPSPSTRPQVAASQRPRPGDNIVFKGSVACRASAPRVEFSPALAIAAVKTASALLASKRPASRQAHALSVDCTCYARQTRAAPTLALVKALRMAHDEALDRVFGPNPGGRVGGTKPGETATQRQSQPRGLQLWRWGKNGGGGDHHHHRGGCQRW